MENMMARALMNYGKPQIQPVQPAQMPNQMGLMAGRPRIQSLPPSPQMPNLQQRWNPQWKGF